MKQKLDMPITARSLLSYALATILTMLVVSVFMMASGAFVSRLIGTDALSAINITMPMTNISVALGLMLATGGSAVVAKKMGEGKLLEARQNFSLICAVALVVGVILSICGLIFIDPIIEFLGGANEFLYQYCYDYAKMKLFLFPGEIKAMLLLVFAITAGQAALGTALSVVSGVTNIGLNYVFIAVFNMGVTGAALATGIGYLIPATIAFCYFLLNRKGTLYYVWPKIDWQALRTSFINGAAEMVNSLSWSAVILLLNLKLMGLIGSDGVAAIAIIFSAQALMNSSFMGYATGIAPIISYNYGKQDNNRVKAIVNISSWVIAISGALIFLFAIIFAGPLVFIFTAQGTVVYEMSVYGFRLFAIRFLFMGFNIFGSSMFAALSKGKVSTTISFMRTLLFPSLCIFLLPLFVGLNGVWLAVPVAEALGLGLTFYYFKRHEAQYDYAG